uniref:Uncharacterized protein n=1 Tax=Hucho hucho TaxID=62062 RepID=A0A4W5QM22_9TELE
GLAFSLSLSLSLSLSQDGVYRGEKLINLKQIADEALEKCREKASATVTRCLVVKHHALRTQSGDVSNKLQVGPDFDQNTDIK